MAESPRMEPSRFKPAKKKILLMGKSGSGKSSMRSIIFSNYVAKDVRRLPATIDVEHAQIKFLGNLYLNLWDCGGQDAFTETYLTSQRSSIFSSVGVLIYVFDTESRSFTSSTSTSPPPAPGSSGNASVSTASPATSTSSTRSDLQTFSTILAALAEYSPNAEIFTLIHKMDLVHTSNHQAYLQSKTSLISSIVPTPFVSRFRVYGTSIWDQSLYAAWGDIVSCLTPNLELMQSYLGKLGQAVDAEEIILFERITMLRVTSITSESGDRNPYPDRWEKLSNFVKSFKYSLQVYTGNVGSSGGGGLLTGENGAGILGGGGEGSSGSTGAAKASRNKDHFAEFTISCPRFNLLLAKLTSNTFVLVVSNPKQGKVALENVRLNVGVVREGLEMLDVPAG